MSNSATGLDGAWKIVTGKTEAEIADKKRRQREDFEFMVVCQAKGNMGMYNLLRDRSVEPRK